MSCTDFPSTGLIPNVTTHTVGNITYIWTGIAWESQVNVPAGELVNDLSQAYEFATLDDAINSTTAFPVGKVITVKERATGAGGGAKWTVALTNTVTPDTYLIVVSTGVPTQSFVLDVSSGEVLVDAAGATRDTADSYGAIQAVLNLNLITKFLGGTYLISQPIESEWWHLKGAGRGSSLTPTSAKTLIRKTTHTLGSAITRDSISYAVDSVASLIHPEASYAQGSIIDGVNFAGISNADRNAIILYQPRCSRFKYSRFVMEHGVVGYSSVATWDAQWDLVEAFQCTTGIEHLLGSSGGGTSWTANNLTTNFCDNGFNLEGLQYSVFNSCYSEATTNTCFKFNSSKNIVMNAGGGENPTGQLLNLGSSDVIINGWQTGLLIGISGVAAIKVNDSNLSINGSIIQDFSAVNGAKNVEVTGSGAPSNVSINDSRVPVLGSETTVDGFSYYSDDKVNRTTKVRGKQTLKPTMVKISGNTANFSNTGVISSVGVITAEYVQIDKRVFYTIRIADVVANGAGSGTIILDVPYSLPVGAFGTCYGSGSSSNVFMYDPTRIRSIIIATGAGTTEWIWDGVFDLE